jgi:hypothetical protein
MSQQALREAVASQDVEKLIAELRSAVGNCGLGYSMNLLLNDAADALSLTLEGEEGWRPIETAPKDGTEILVWIVHEPDEYHDERFERASLAYWLEAHDHPMFPREARWEKAWIGEPVAWRPLPAPPASSLIVEGGGLASVAESTDAPACGAAEDTPCKSEGEQ